MQGPFKAGTYSTLGTSTDWERGLERGQRYRVVKSFRDADGAVHCVGEAWRFIGSNFSPYDDGLSVFVADDDDAEWHIRLGWRPHEQLQVCENFSEYVQPVTGD